MANLRRESLLWVSSLGIVLTFFLIHLIEGNKSYDLVVFLECAETTVTITSLLIACFIGFAWRWRIFAGWLVILPDLGGSWLGVITPLGGDGTLGPPLAAVLVVRQRLLSVSATLWTRKATSSSYAAEVFCDEQSGERRITYSYTSEPQLRYRDENPRHDGTAVLSCANLDRLSGRYWTDRLTRGEIALKKFSSKTNADTKDLLTMAESEIE